MAELMRGRAAALIIGNELLSGKIADANLVVLARTLRSLGRVLDRVVMVRDESDVITREVQELSSCREVLFTSGGVGPTHDDVTIDAVADAFDVDVIMSPEMAAMLRGFYGEGITDDHLRMARIPRGGRLVTTPEMPWPTIVMRNVWILPGVPEIFAMKMPVVVSELGEGAAFVSTAVYATLDEGQLKPWLDQVCAAHEGIEIGSYPKWKHPRYRTQVTFDGASSESVKAARDAFVALLPDGVRVDLDAGD